MGDPRKMDSFDLKLDIDSGPEIPGLELGMFLFIWLLREAV